MSSRVRIGVISCLAPDTLHLASRIKMQQKQIQNLNFIQSAFIDKYCVALPWYRIEQGWSTETENILKAPGCISIKYATPITPGAARNRLLYDFYESSDDWLICMDDDHGFVLEDNSFSFVVDLASDAFKRFASQGCFINTTPRQWCSHYVTKDKRQRAETLRSRNWLIGRPRYPGAMPIGCIPNLVKYKMKPIWFDEVTDCVTNIIPEDLRFCIDWIAAGHSWAACRNAMIRSYGNLNNSSLYATKEERKSRDKVIESEWTSSYLKSLYPSKPELHNLKTFLKLKNHIIKEAIPKEDL